MSTSDALGDVLRLPQRLSQRLQRKMKTIKAVCITDENILQELEIKKRKSKRSQFKGRSDF